MDNFAQLVLEDLDALDPSDNDTHAMSEARKAQRDAAGYLLDRAHAAGMLGLHDLAEGLRGTAAIMAKAFEIADTCFSHRLNEQFKQSKQSTRQMVACALAGHTAEGNELAAAFAGVETDGKGNPIGG